MACCWASDEPPASESVARPRPCEVTAVHTRILRNMLACDDSYAYWQRVDVTVPASDRARLAFEQRWFGARSEARVITLVGDMVARFDAYPEALSLLHELGTVPAPLRPLICHVHTQLTDPIYRRFTGELLPARRDQGTTTIDRDTVARWIESLAPGRWAAATSIKFASNLLSTALDAGLVRGKRDPRPINTSPVPDAIIGYVLYLLRGVGIDGTLTDNPYLRSLGVRPDNFASVTAGVPGIRFAELAGVTELTFLEPSLTAWGRQALRGTP